MEEENKQPEPQGNVEQNALPPRQLSSVEKTVIEALVIEAIRTCYDPEIPVNIFELGLIYGVEISDEGDVLVNMTLTTPYCPAAQSLPPGVQQKVQSVAGVKSVRINIVWEPPWNPSMMSEAAKLELGMF
jgi:FeS assembly SUF system protein